MNYRYKIVVFSVFIFFLTLLLIGIGFVNAEEYTIAPRYMDVVPGDGLMEVGTRQNPYVIEDQSGREIGTMQPRHYDLAPNDGFMDKGTWQNPYEIEIEDNNHDRSGW